MDEETGKPREPEQAEPVPEVAKAPDGVVDPVKRGHTWGCVAHLSALAGFAGVPLGNLLGPLVVWLTTRDKYSFAEDQGREALNFQLSVLVYSLACIPLFCICLGAVLLAALHIFNLVFIILAGIKASNGEIYRYPLCIRFIH